MIATHSVEIMSEVTPDQVLIVDRGREEARFASDIPELQQFIRHVGGIHNLDLARILNNKRCLFIEGNEIGILKHFQNTLFPSSPVPIDSVAKSSIGGWGGWQYVVGSSMWLEENTAGVSVYCALDSDYYTAEQKRARREEAAKKSIRLMVWTKKEIENYLLVPAAIQRLISSRAKSAGPSLDDVEKALDRFAEELKESVEFSICEQILVNKKAQGPWKREFLEELEAAKKFVQENWETLDARLSIVSGKAVLSKLSKWAQDEFNVNINASSLAVALRPAELPRDVRAFLYAFENNEPIPE
ncbi:MAG: hypothetical protein ACRD3E_02650 [Terriglobales bacterium]